MRGLVPDLISPHPLGSTLPVVFREDDFTQRFCAGLDDVLAPVIATLDSLPAYFDPATHQLAIYKRDTIVTLGFASTVPIDKIREAETTLMAKIAPRL